MENTTQKSHVSLVNELGESELRRQVRDSFNLQRSLSNTEVLNRFELMRDEHQDFILSIAARIMIPARQPSPAMAGELSEEEIKDAWNRTVQADNWTGFHEFSHPYKTSLVKFVNRILSLRPVSPITQTPQLTETEIAQYAVTALEALDAQGRGIPLRVMSKEQEVFFADFAKLLFAAFSKRLSIPETPRIYTKCPACGYDTLTINDDKHLLCTWHKCPDPTLIDKGPLPATPGYHKTAEKPPTEKDANADGAVLGWRGGRWTDVHWNQEWRGQGPDCMATQYPFWKPQDPDPVSPVTAEDAACKKANEAARKVYSDTMNADSAYTAMWLEAKAFFTGEGK